jgi:methylenetetrahydrofolate reductase (NADPH)
MAQRSGANVPLWLVRKFEGLDDDLETRKLISATVVAEQVEKLRRHGFDSFHFYTLNQADLTYAICHLLGVRPQAAAKSK